MTNDIIIERIAWYGVFLFSVTLHEAAHAWLAMKTGDLTAHSGGQVTLNPMPHIRRSPFGMVLLPIVSLLVMGWPFGYASAPYDPEWAQRHHRKAALMALAGPASNFCIVLLAAAAMRLGLETGIFDLPQQRDAAHLISSAGAPWAVPAAMLISQFFTMNIILTTLNLLPVPPLDGSEIISLFLNTQQAHRFRTLINNPAFGIIGLILAWNIFPHVFRVVFALFLPIIYG